MLSADAVAVPQVLPSAGPRATSQLKRKHSLGICSQQGRASQNIVVAEMLKRAARFICLASLLPGLGLMVSWISTCRRQVQLNAAAALPLPSGGYS